MKQIKLLLLILMYLPAQSGLQAQETVPASGGNAAGNNGSMSYTMGQVFYSPVTSANSMIAEGVQQPYEISRVTSSDEIMEFSNAISVYPNPTTEQVVLEIGNLMDEDLRYHLINAHGQFLSGKKLVGSETTIPLGNYAPGVYFIIVFRNHEATSTFKIIKN